MTVTDVVIVDGEETTVPKRMCRAKGASGYARAEPWLGGSPARRGRFAAARARRRRAGDPRNPTCPGDLNWSTYRQMRFTARPTTAGACSGRGAIDDDVPARLEAALDEQCGRSTKSGSARPAAMRAPATRPGKMIRKTSIPTRIPAGWACFSACNFMFMGGPIRFVDHGGLFIVHMFTHTRRQGGGPRRSRQGADKAIGLIGDIEQDSAMLASEDNDFLIRMGVSRKLLTDVMYQQKAVAEQRATSRPAAA